MLADLVHVVPISFEGVVLFNLLLMVISMVLVSGKVMKRVMMGVCIVDTSDGGDSYRQHSPEAVIPEQEGEYQLEETDEFLVDATTIAMEDPTINLSITIDDSVGAEAHNESAPDSLSPISAFQALRDMTQVILSSIDLTGLSEGEINVLVSYLGEVSAAFNSMAMTAQVLDREGLKDLLNLVGFFREGADEDAKANIINCVWKMKVENVAGKIAMSRVDTLIWLVNRRAKEIKGVARGPSRFKNADVL